jgi:hypothetical protein
VGLATHDGQTYTVAPAETPAQRAAVYALRESEYAYGQPYLLSPVGSSRRHRASDVYDDRSHVFGCWASNGRELVATCRFTTALGGRFELDDLASGFTPPPVPQDTLVESSRVVVRRDRRATGLVEAMLLMAGSWLLAETPYRYNFAVCARPLVRLYARLGMKLTSDRELELRGRPLGKRYVVIYGDMETSKTPVLARLGALGWEISSDTPQKRRAGT